MALKHSYTLLAPVYDSVLSGPIDEYRKKSISRIKNAADKHVLINGMGTGLDIPYLPEGARYTGTDITPAMLKRAQKRAEGFPVDIKFQLADSQALPFEDNSFDAVIMHLILAVVPRPELVLKEACRVLKPEGKIYIFDKFLRPGQLAIVRRTLNIFIRHIATRTDVVFEDALKTCPDLEIIHDIPALAKGWFRLIELRKLSVGSH